MDVVNRPDSVAGYAVFTGRSILYVGQIIRRIPSIPYIVLWFLLAGVGLFLIVVLVMVDAADVLINWTRRRMVEVHP